MGGTRSQQRAGDSGSAPFCDSGEQKATLQKQFDGLLGEKQELLKEGLKEREREQIKTMSHERERDSNPRPYENGA